MSAYAEIFNDPSVVQGTMQIPYTSIEERLGGYWVNSVNRFLVAEVDARVVGAINVHLGTGRRAHAASFGMGVLSAFQGRGIGSALLEAVLELADNWYGLDRVELEVYADNAAAVRLYERFGFVIEGRLRAYGYRDGRYADVYAMARLRPGTVSTLNTGEGPDG